MGSFYLKGRGAQTKLNWVCVIFLCFIKIIINVVHYVSHIDYEGSVFLPYLPLFLLFNCCLFLSILTYHYSSVTFLIINVIIIFEIMGMLHRNATMQLLLYYHVMQNVIQETGNHQVSLCLLFAQCWNKQDWFAGNLSVNGH